MPLNILLITVDDMNYDTPGCFGGPDGITPNIDKLADQGMRFEQAHITLAICQASRQSLMTGRFPHNAGFRWFGPLGTPEILNEMNETGHEDRVEFFRKRCIEELYDFEADPDGLNNLAGIPEYEPMVREMREDLLQWMRNNKDSDLLPEYELFVKNDGDSSDIPFGKGYKN